MDLKKNMRPIILGLLVITLAVAFITAASNRLAPVNLISTATNESFSIATSRMIGNNINDTADVNYTVQFAQNATSNSPISNFVLLNASGGTIGAGNYSVDTTVGRFSMRNTTYTVGLISNQTYVSYNYYDSDYDDAGYGYGNILGIGIFLAVVGVLIVVIAANWPHFKELMGYD